MGAQPSRLAWKPAAIAPGQALAWAGVAGATAVWTAVVVRLHFHPTAFNLGDNSRVVVVYGLPALLFAAVAFDEHLAALRAVRAGLIWCGLVLAAYIAAHQIVTHDVTLLAVPALLAAAVIVHRM